MFAATAAIDNKVKKDGALNHKYMLSRIFGTESGFGKEWLFFQVLKWNSCSIIFLEVYFGWMHWYVLILGQFALPLFIRLQGKISFLSSFSKQTKMDLVRLLGDQDFYDFDPDPDEKKDPDPVPDLSSKIDPDPDRYLGLIVCSRSRLNSYVLKRKH